LIAIYSEMLAKFAASLAIFAASFDV